MKVFSHTLATLSVFALLGVGPIAQAQSANYTFFHDNTTVDYTVSTQFSVVGFASGLFGTSTHPIFLMPSSPTVNIVSGANFIGTDGMAVYNHSIVNMSGGNFIGGMVAYNDSIVNVSGGNAGYALVTSGSGNGTINMSGGSIETLYADGTGVINLSGGNVSGVMQAINSGTLNLSGLDLTATLVDPRFNNYCSLFSVSGRLRDGTVLTNKEIIVQNGTGHFTITNVPAPSSALILLIGAVPGIAVLLKRRSQ